MSPALQAHLRLLHSLPVRTHTRRNDEPVDRRGWNGGKQAKTTEKVKALIKKYRKDGGTYKQIKVELKVSTATIRKAIAGR